MTTKKTECDPGWNDPPTMAYGVQGTAKPKVPLNKRIAYPLNTSADQANSTSPKPSSTTNLPPITQLELINTPKSSDEQNISDDNELLLKVIHNIDNIIKDIDQENKKNEILKRVGILKTMWNEKKLNSHIHKQILDLTEYLISGDIDKANNIHLDLMVKFAGVCSTWMVGIKYMIHHCRSKKGMYLD